MPSKDHIHKLVRHRYASGNVTYLCVDDCSFKMAPEFLVGRKVICHKCGQAFPLTKYSLTLNKPHCQDCHKYKTVFMTDKPVGRRSIDVPIRQSEVKDSSLSALQERLESVGMPSASYIPYTEEDEEI